MSPPPPSRPAAYLQLIGAALTVTLAALGLAACGGTSPGAIPAATAAPTTATPASTATSASTAAPTTTAAAPTTTRAGSAAAAAYCAVGVEEKPAITKYGNVLSALRANEVPTAKMVNAGEKLAGVFKALAAAAPRAIRPDVALLSARYTSLATELKSGHLKQIKVAALAFDKSDVRGDLTKIERYEAAYC